VAFRLTGSDETVIVVKPMDESHALALLRKKLGGNLDKKEVVELARSLDYMPLAITQAAAYISQRAPRSLSQGISKTFKEAIKESKSLKEG
jgi:hypothetical protein